MGFQLLQAPAIEPVTLAEAKAHLHVTSTAEDATLTAMITAAREWCEDYTRRKFISQKWRMLLDAFPGYIDQRLGGNIVTSPVAIGATSYMAGLRWAIVPPWPPISSVDALRFLGPDGNMVLLTENTDYVVDLVSNPARITPPFGKFWPISRIQVNAVQVDFTTGYGNPGASPPTGVAVPERIKLAIKILAAHLFDNRWAVAAETLKEVPFGIQSLLCPFRDLRLT